MVYTQPVFLKMVTLAAIGIVLHGRQVASPPVLKVTGLKRSFKPNEIVTFTVHNASRQGQRITNILVQSLEKEGWRAYCEDTRTKMYGQAVPIIDVPVHKNVTLHWNRKRVPGWYKPCTPTKCRLVIYNDALDARGRVLVVLPEFILNVR